MKGYTYLVMMISSLTSFLGQVHPIFWVFQDFEDHNDHNNNIQDNKLYYMRRQDSSQW